MPSLPTEPRQRGEAVLASHWAALSAAIEERGGVGPTQPDRAENVNAVYVLTLRTELERILGRQLYGPEAYPPNGYEFASFANEDTGEIWTLPTILAHLEIGEEGDWTDPDLQPGDPVKAVPLQRTDDGAEGAALAAGGRDVPVVLVV